MTREIKIAPPNSIVFVMDPESGVVPLAMNGSAIASTPTCIAIGTLCEVDGETLISISDENFGDDCGILGFDGRLETPSKRFSIVNSRNESLATIQVKMPWTRIRIRTNEVREPDKICILVD